MVDTLRLTSEICTQRHHEGLFRKMKENLPEFFGFESVGVLIYNFKSKYHFEYMIFYIANWLFTDPDTVKEHKTQVINEDDEEYSEIMLQTQENSESHEQIKTSQPEF